MYFGSDVREQIPLYDAKVGNPKQKTSPDLLRGSTKMV